MFRVGLICLIVNLHIMIDIVFAQRFSRTLQMPFDCDGNSLSRHSTPSSEGEHQYRLVVVGNPSSYIPNQQYTVSLQSNFPASFRGFAIRATSDEGNSPGTIQPRNPHTARTMTSCDNVATHINEGKKARIEVLWTAPSSGCVQLSASVLQKGNVWYKDGPQLSVRICPQNTTSSLLNSSSCCACGSAIYRMTFYGLWSPQTHPRDYPTYSTHWSNIIGASHSGDYVIWEYGGYANEGVQKVAEWGWSDNLEQEIRAQSKKDVMSVIKTKAQWPAYQPRNLREPPSDEFQVDSKRHYVSLLTMLGPSPDWNVGLSGKSMCTEGCGWIGTRTFDLIPWDAGTDSGVTYMAVNSPTVPHKPIRNLTSSDHPNSPFFDPSGRPIPPVARIVIRRISLEGEQCGENEDVEDEEDQLPSASPRGSSIQTSCMYAEWSRWSECAVTCGWGIKMKTRMLKFGGDDCVSTTEKEICLGTGQCGNNSDVTVCLYSDWSQWSDCDGSCENSLKFRLRELQWPSEPENCGEPLKEMTQCTNPDCGCVYSSWSYWMSCPVTCGLGQTIRKRTSQGLQCTSPLVETTQCMTSMSCQSEDLQTPGCVYTPWSDWSDCPVTCGISQSVRKRFLQSASATSCDSFMMETSKCMTSSSCVSACAYSGWSDWMPCSTSCGVGDTMRKKFLTSSDNNACESVMIERAPCRNGPCDAAPTSQCNYLPWSGWMPCSVSCGKGETLRKRFLNQTASATFCENFEMETNLCMVACDVKPASQCLYSDWTDWTSCKRSCKRFRKKLLNQDSDRQICNRIVRERSMCTGGRCQSKCLLSQWSDWSSCESACDDSRRRSRSYQFRSRRPLTKKTSRTKRRRCGKLRQRQRCFC